jgi:hypothetical protein
MLAALAHINGLVTLGDDIRLQIVEPGGERWWLKASSGETLVGRGAIAEPDLWIKATSYPLMACWTRPVGADAGVPDVSIDGTSWAPMFPLGVWAQSDEADLVPNVSLTVQHVNHSSPIGTIRYSDRFVDGRLAGREYGVVRRPDVIVENTFARMVASLQPGLSLLEAIAGARVYGRDPSLLMIAAALYEDDDLRRHIHHDSTYSMELCALASNTQSPAWFRAIGWSDPVYG